MSIMRSRSVAIVALLGLLAWVAWSARALDHARKERDLVRADAAAATAPPPSASGFAAADDASARAALSRWLGDRAVAAGVRASLVPLTSTVPGQVRLKLSARGSEPALRHFLRAAETPGLLRLGHWLVAPDASGDLRLSAEIAANWSKAAAPLPTSMLPPEDAARLLFAADAAASVTPLAGDVPELIGIAGRLPDDASAILRLGNGTTRSFPRGASADGWLIAAIAADRVTLTKSGRTHVAVLPPTSK